MNIPSLKKDIESDLVTYTKLNEFLQNKREYVKGWDHIFQDVTKIARLSWSKTSEVLQLDDTEEYMPMSVLEEIKKYLKEITSKHVRERKSRSTS